MSHLRSEEGNDHDFRILHQRLPLVFAGSLNTNVRCRELYRSHDGEGGDVAMCW